MVAYLIPALDVDKFNPTVAVSVLRRATADIHLEPSGSASGIGCHVLESPYREPEI
jgi:hypothetical protein